jgi:hypothetical protein
MGLQYPHNHHPKADLDIVQCQKLQKFKNLALPSPSLRVNFALPQAYLYIQTSTAISVLFDEASRRQIIKKAPQAESEQASETKATNEALGEKIERADNGLHALVVVLLLVQSVACYCVRRV